MVEPALNLQVTEIASKSMRVTWDPSLGDVTGYKLTLNPMLAGLKRQELYTGPTHTSINVRDLSPETVYEISLYALKGLTPSEPIVATERTQPVKVTTGKTPDWKQQSTAGVGNCFSRRATLGFSLWGSKGRGV